MEVYKVNEMIKIRNTFIIILLILFGWFVISLYLDSNEANERFVNTEYSAIIKKIKYIHGDRGIPTVMLDEQWIHLGLYGDKVRGCINIGDSIVKESGTEVIKVYRKNSENKWDERVFK